MVINLMFQEKQKYKGFMHMQAHTAKQSTLVHTSGMLFRESREPIRLCNSYGMGLGLRRGIRRGPQRRSCC